MEAIAPRLSRLGDESFVDARGGALLPGLHDHHLHLFSLAAALESVACGPPDALDVGGLARQLAKARRGRDGWIRGVGYHDSVAGPLDAQRLSALGDDAAPIRVQHRSGALWIVSRAGLAALGVAERARPDDPPGLERDAEGRATGRLFDGDAWLGARLPKAAPDLARVGTRLAAMGVSGATDATPSNDAAVLEALAAARRSGALPQRLDLMGGLDLPPSHEDGLRRGAVKIVLRDAALPDPDELAARISEAHAHGRAIAIHCVTRAELALAACALGEAGSSHAGDRIEHASVAPPELVACLAALGVSVVTQPNFLYERGDAYACEVDPTDRPWLYRGSGFVGAGVRLGGGTDAPFGAPDPWRAMQAAVDRRSRSGLVLGADEALTPERALALFTTAPDDPGGAPRRVAAGAPADLCLLDRPWKQARDRLDAGDVAGTWCAGLRVYRRAATAG
ncbi:MAG TPA: amidohydrolase family protein [Myxococcota bacterium]|nr:amidohydrolase family protein [Myxococcota bacterium]